jgi:type IV pilus assembly protein PilM
MAKRIVTLFIRDESINLLVVNGLQVEKWARLELEPSLVTQGMINDEAQVADRVRQLLRTEKIGANKVIAGIGGLNSLYRLITLPEMPEALMGEAVKREAKRVMPISPDEVYLSYQPIPSPRGERRLFLAAFPRNRVDALLRTSRRAGVEPYIMDLAPLALSRIPDMPRAIVLNARAEHADIIVIEDRLPQLIRVLSLPSEAKSLKERLPAIIEELNRTVVFYNSSHMEKPLDSNVPLLVAGEVAQERETWQSLSGRLNNPVSLLPSPLESPPDFPANDFMVNIGLALKELAQQREKADSNFSIVNLNVLPEAYQPKRIPMSKVLVPIIVIIGVGLLGYMGYFVMNNGAQTDVLRSQLALAQRPITERSKEIASLKEQIQQIEPQLKPVEAEIAQVNTTAGIFETTLSALDNNRAQADRKLHTITGLREKASIDLLEVNYDKTTDSAEISGTALYEKDIFDYTRALRSSGDFPELIITLIESIQEGQGFNFKVLLK